MFSVCYQKAGTLLLRLFDPRIFSMHPEDKEFFLTQAQRRDGGQRQPEWTAIHASRRL